MDVFTTIKDSPVLFGFGTVVLYLIAGAIYRLYFSPIAKFPGPKLAAVTSWYEFYYDIILRGQYTFKVRDLHAKYGPIVRINPFELHVSDPDFYEVLYAGGNKRRERFKWYARGLGLPFSMLGTIEHDLHRKRRMALSGYFSTQSARRLQPVIQERVDTFTGRLDSFKGSNTIVPLNLAYCAYSNDVVMQYCFGRTDHRLEADGFDPDFYHTSFSAGTMNALMRHMNWILQIMRSIPESLALQTGPEMASFIVLKRERCNQIEEIRNNPDLGKKDVSHPTIFHDLLTSTLPESEKSTERLAEEAVLLVGAGTHTAAWALSIATFYLLSQPSTLGALKSELSAAIPKPTDVIPLAILEKLPYLTGVIKEGLRLSYGESSRIPRISPDAPLQLDDWIIPAGTPVSMTSTLMHHDESVFPDSYAFKPERWVNDPTGHLDRYMVAFTKGSRNCLGMPLALAEMYLCLAGIFRRFGGAGVREKDDEGMLELFETDATDVKMIGDLFFPLVKPDSKGIRVKVLN